MVTKAPDPIDKHVGSRVRMRRLMLRMSQTALGDQLGLTFHQIQKYEKATNRISASRLPEMGHALHVSVSFSFDGAPQIAGRAGEDAAKAPEPACVSDFLATSDGLALVEAFTQMGNAKLRRALVHLVEEIARDVGGR